MERIHHSDVIGSLLRPRYLTQARDEYAAGQLDAPAFKRIEDRAVDEAIELQEGIGLDVITDGEFRRFSFFDQIVSEIDGTAPIESAPVHFKNAEADWVWHNPFTVTGKISQRRKLTIEEFAYNRARADSQIKITLPSPLFLYSGWSPELSTAAYKDAFELFEDAAAIIRAEATALAELGCTYIQIDSPDIGTIVDPENRELRESRGMPTERTLGVVLQLPCGERSALVFGRLLGAVVGGPRHMVALVPIGLVAAVELALGGGDLGVALAVHRSGGHHGRCRPGRSEPRHDLRRRPEPLGCQGRRDRRCQHHGACR
jgi:hypothetical protein